MNDATHYQLPWWVETDRILRTDFNDSYQKLDDALGGIQSEVDANARSATAALAAKGNCQLYTASYVGTGGYGSASPTVLTFPKAPLLVLVSGGTENSWGVGARKVGLISQGGHLFLLMMSNTGTWPTTWSADGRTVSWYAVNADADRQFNAAGVTYHVAALLPAGT